MSSHPINFADAMEAGTLSKRETGNIPDNGKTSTEPGIKNVQLGTGYF